jgi:four helix bundle protein
MSDSRYHDLEVWRTAYDLALRVYEATSQFPAEERYGITQQLRKAAVAVFANIAEGQSRGSRKEFAQFCMIARGSRAEVDALLPLSRDLRFLDPTTWQELADGYDRVSRMLNKLITALKAKP